LLEELGRKMSDFKGDIQSKLEKGILNQRVSNKDLILAAMNPLVQALSGTDTQLKFSKPFYHNVYDPKGKVDVEMSYDIAENLEDIDFFSWAQVADSDGFRGGRGVAELAWGKDSNSGYVNYTAMQRRPYDSFIRPKNDKIISTALRWKGMYYDNEGTLNFDQTINSGTKSGKIVSLDKNQVFSLSPLGSRFIDESILEYLLPYIDLAAYSFDLIYVVMNEQINPKDLVITDENLPGTSDIAKNILEGNNSIENTPIPPNMSLNRPHYYDRQDILSFYNFATRELYKIVFPISALSDGGEGKSALLDNSSASAKMSTFFAYIQSGRLKFCREASKLGNNWLDINGFKKKGYRYSLIPAPIEPKDTQNELKIMIAARGSGDISQQEYRNWINSSVIGIRLQENFESEEDLGQKVQPKVDSAVSKVLDKVADGDDPIQAMADVVAR